MSRVLVITLLLLVFGLTASGEEAAKAQPKASPVEIERLIKQLGSDRFAEREAASKALKQPRRGLTALTRGAGPGSGPPSPRAAPAAPLPELPPAW